MRGKKPKYDRLILLARVAILKMRLVIGRFSRAGVGFQPIDADAR
jgi:hypothetical protein